MYQVILVFYAMDAICYFHCSVAVFVLLRLLDMVLVIYQQLHKDGYESGHSSRWNTQCSSLLSYETYCILSVGRATCGKFSALKVHRCSH
jgi:hypothetical protein